MVRAHHTGGRALSSPRARSAANQVTLGPLEANGMTFTVRTAGPDTGRPVVLLHGFPQTSLCFAATSEALATAGYRTLAPDQRGYSPGARPERVEEYGIDQLASDVLALADVSDMPRFDVVGHDWGAMVGWWLAGRHPDRVRTFTSVSTPHPAALAGALRGGDPDQKKRSAYLDVFRQPGLAEDLLLGEERDGERLRMVFAGVDEGAVAAYVEAMCVPGALTAALNWYRAVDLHRMPETLRIEVPTMYVWSTEDIALGRRAAEATESHVDGPYRFEVLEGVSHWIPDVAADSLDALLLEHLAAWD